MVYNKVGEIITHLQNKEQYTIVVLSWIRDTQGYIMGSDNGSIHLGKAIMTFFSFYVFIHCATKKVYFVCKGYSLISLSAPVSSQDSSVWVISSLWIFSFVFEFFPSNNRNFSAWWKWHHIVTVLIDPASCVSQPNFHHIFKWLFSRFFQIDYKTLWIIWP